MFQALLAHLQEALHKQQLVYYVGWLLPELEWNSTPTLVAASRHNMHAIYSAAPPEDKQIVLETC
jgi:hypothetical protein